MEAQRTCLQISTCSGDWVACQVERLLCPCAVDLLRAEEVVCRAWDEAMNTQPDSFTWNLMGMLNNCHYRVKVGHPRQIGHIVPRV